ncbi:unnamed protein product [Pleuronectes platessa]|uniref:Uncharacterized protein n=1 Tax=Pleuronectes platessa TaxID=8262 RepID=A0A9N7TL23_PLEPL|nr:unnamed protein product [Pleuronectes platessa]
MWERASERADEKRTRGRASMCGHEGGKGPEAVEAEKNIRGLWCIARKHTRTETHTYYHTRSLGGGRWTAADGARWRQDNKVTELYYIPQRGGNTQAVGLETECGENTAGHTHTHTVGRRRRRMIPTSRFEDALEPAPRDRDGQDGDEFSTGGVSAVKEQRDATMPWEAPVPQLTMVV